MIELDAPAHASEPQRSVWTAIRHGLKSLCPACGEGALFWKYLKVSNACPSCAQELHHHRADDAPPYFTMSIVGHIVIAGVLVLEKAYAPPTWVHLALWLPLTVLLSLWLLPRVKGALIGLQWAFRMHGFGGAADQPDPPPAPSSGTA